MAMQAAKQASRASESDNAKVQGSAAPLAKKVLERYKEETNKKGPFRQVGILSPIT